MRFSFMEMLKGILALSCFVSAAMAIDSVDHLKPGLHFTPPHGFMNDPNGLLWDGKRFHLYYQTNPSAPVARNVHWGHATSKDMLSWHDEPLAILIDAKGGQPFSGSAVVNTSGDITAIFTRAYHDLQVQSVATSHDNGTTYGDEIEVLDLGLANFRDPDVKWHAQQQQWVMAVAKSRQHRVAFYSSPDLISWTHLSDFGPYGLLGVDYECPDLIRVPTDGANGTEAKWVLIVSINPGAPQGGSATQYFVGDFNGTHFVPESGVVQMLDFAKDNYAMKDFNDMPAGELPTYITWVGNWQYIQDTPTGQWRGAMSLPRTLQLRRDVYGEWRLAQHARGLETLRLSTTNLTANASNSLPEGPIELDLNVRAHSGRSSVQLTNAEGEVLEVGFDATTSQLWLDRGGLHGFSNPYFTDKMAAALAPGIKSLNIQLVLDGSTLEIYAENGMTVGTALVYPSNILTDVQFQGNATWTGTLSRLRPVMAQTRKSAKM